MRKHLSVTTGPQRLAYGAVAGTTAAALAWPLDGVARGLFGWCCGAVVYLALAWWLANTFDAPRTRQRAQSLDQPNLMMLISMLTAITVSVVAVAMLLLQVRQLDGLQRAGHIALGLLSLAASWLMIQTIYAFHYAHRYYQEEMQDEPDGAGLYFPGRLDPDYFDFLYYSHVVGMTSQVSDVQVTSREMRRITLVHGVLSFAFNMMVLALSINVVAGVMQ